MFINSDYFQDIYDSQGNFLGVFVSQKLWSYSEQEIIPIFEQAIHDLESGKGPKKIEVEPIEDWNFLLKHWDFKYPVDMDVYCSLCGNQTNDWLNDEPRKFKLMAASLGGLVRFRCMNCQAKILKKHFKDHISIEIEKG